MIDKGGRQWPIDLSTGGQLVVAAHHADDVIELIPVPEQMAIHPRMSAIDACRVGMALQAASAYVGARKARRR